MNNELMFRKLLELNEIERVGKQYYLLYGKEISYSQYIALSTYPVKETTLPLLQTPAFIAKHEMITQLFRSLYSRNGLTDQDFINDDRDIEIEKLLRYIDIPAHSHNFLECVYVLTGSCSHIINGNTYAQVPGSFTIMPSHTAHKVHASPDCLCLTVKIRHETFINFKVPNLPYFSVPLYFDCGDDPFIKDQMLNIMAQQEANGCYCNEIISHLFQVVLIHCMQKHRDTMQFLFSGTLLQGKMLDISTYMFENFQTVTLKSLADHFNYSESYLCRLIRQYSGESFTQIMKSYRLDRASKLLLDTNMKLDDICDAIGYKDATQFIRDFKKKYQMTPSKYRKKYNVQHQ